MQSNARALQVDEGDGCRDAAKSEVWTPSRHRRKSEQEVLKASLPAIVCLNKVATSRQFALTQKKIGEGGSRGEVPFPPRGL